MSSFDKKASSWDKNIRRQAVADAVAKNIKECVKLKNIDILDFGCGTGLVSYNLIDIAKTIEGIDTSSKMVEMFNKKSNSLNIKASTKDLMDIDKQFDLIVSSMTFHHIKDIEDTIKKLSKILKDGGKICIADLYKEDGTFHDNGNEGVYHFGFEPKSFINIFENIGFKNICKKIVYKIDKKDREFPLFLLCFQKVD